MPLFNSRRQGGSGAGKVTELHPAFNTVKKVANKIVKPLSANDGHKQTDYREDPVKAEAARQVFF